MFRTLSSTQIIRQSVRRLLSTFRTARVLSNQLEWSPSANFIVHNDQVSTSISFAPCTNTRQAGRYFWEFRLFGRNPTEPLYVYKSEAMELHGQETLHSADICRAAGLSKLFHYCEVMAYSPDVQPTGVSSVLVSYHHFTSRDGRFVAHLPAAYIWGAARFTRTERFHYENFPGAVATNEQQLVVITLNPFVRPTKYWISTVDALGGKYEEGPFRIPGKGVSRWDGVNVPHGSLKNPLGVIVRSDSKTASFVGATDLPSGRMIDLEHMHPFFSR